MAVRCPCIAPMELVLIALVNPQPSYLGITVCAHITVCVLVC